MGETNLLERLAALEHQQWATWTRYFLRGKHTPQDLARWVAQMNQTYEQLPEEDKEKDRMWARKVLEIMNDGE